MTSLSNRLNWGWDGGGGWGGEWRPMQSIQTGSCLLVAVRSLYKEGTRRGRELPCYSTVEVGRDWKRGLPKGRGQERFPGTSLDF